MTHHQDEGYGDIIDGEINRLDKILNRRGNRLRFSARLERQFREYYNNEFLTYRRISLAIALVVIGAIGLLDIIVFGEHYSKVAYVRYGSGIPIVGTIAIVTLSKYFHNRQQEIVTQACLYVSLAATAILLVAPDYVYPLYSTAYTLLMLFVGVVARVIFARAFVLMAVTCVAFNLLITWARPQPIEIIATFNAYYLCASAMALSANYYMERGVRREFIHEKILNLERSQLREMNMQLARMATIDPLTGIDNRRQLETHLQKEWKRCLREEKPLSIIMTDIDSFKKFNDNYGHQQGDYCLEKVAKTIKETFKRASDTVARYGGEEFAVLLPDTQPEPALELANNMCTNVAGLGLVHEYSDTADQVTISVGVATCIPSAEMSYEKLLWQADTALYHAKKQGKNRAVTYEEGMA